MSAGLGVTMGTATSVAVSTGSSARDDALVVPTATLGDGLQGGGADGYAAALADLVERSGADPGRVVLAHPDGWDADTVDAVRTAAAGEQLSQVTFVPESVAAAVAARAEAGSDLVAVYDLGASALDVAVVRTGAPTDLPELVGTPAHDADISGDVFDDLVLAHVLESVGADANALFAATDHATVDALAELRSRCTAAKEELSAELDTALAVDLPGVSGEAHLSRAEFESLVQSRLFASMTVLRSTVAASGYTLRDIGALVLTGGAATSPVVASMLSGVLRVPVIVGADPTTTTASGAAALAAGTGSGAAIATAPRAVAATASTRRAAAAGAGPRRKRLAIVGGLAALVALIAAGAVAVAATSDSDSPSADENVPTAINPLTETTTTTALIPSSIRISMPGASSGTSSSAASSAAAPVTAGAAPTAQAPATVPQVVAPAPTAAQPVPEDTQTQAVTPRTTTAPLPTQSPTIRNGGGGGVPITINPPKLPNLPGLPGLP